MRRNTERLPHKNTKVMRLRRLACVLFGFLFLLAALNPRMIVRTYVIDAENISSPIKIAFVTDLHSCKYGNSQQSLIDAVAKQEPDIVMLGGDIFDDVLPDINTEQFISGISGEFPCYYVSGNHEYWSGAKKFAEQMSVLQEYGVVILSGESKTISINGESINVCGIDDPEAFVQAKNRRSAFISQIEAVSSVSSNGYYTVLLSHRPEYFEVYSEYGFDLVLCGHAHGGQFRIPFILNGLYAPNQGLFPEYAGGQYFLQNTSMIVSRGLAIESTRLPRIFNRPELLMIEIR